MKMEDLQRIAKRVKGEGARLVYHPRNVLVQGYYGESFSNLRDQVVKYFKK